MRFMAPGAGSGCMQENEALGGMMDERVGVVCSVLP